MEQVMETTNFGLKLLVDRKAHKFVFAECGKDFIDFLFTILKLPIGYFFGQPSKMFVLGCLGNMIPIMENFGDDLMQLDELGEVMTWIITDDLFIAPLSATSVINVLKKSKAQVDPLQHKTIDFQISDLKQEFLQVSLKSKTILTDLFLRQTGWRKANDGEKCSVKLTVDSEANRVVFVEGGKDFFWFLMSLPQLAILSVGNIYQNIINPNEAYIKSNQTKDKLLISSESKSWSQALELFQATPNMFLDNDGGYVKGLIVYMVTDDLSVTPLSMISALSKLDMCTSAESTAEFEVKIVEFGVNKALGFLKASFQSKTVLSNTFLER
ncbi:hypothetical protein R3W88_014740 [Solanum pinnatisectum]|uniref:DUF674 family protein n=1 Tax=Solanum pinnatisectum TaxID=50273 RepID=A0AAV9KTR3_9SOLN|nr:hypothetical protein R3W88_014740 [Solanum pinnatisectum]